MRSVRVAFISIQYIVSVVESQNLYPQGLACSANSTSELELLVAERRPKSWFSEMPLCIALPQIKPNMYISLMLQHFDQPLSRLQAFVVGVKTRYYTDPCLCPSNQAQHRWPAWQPAHQTLITYLVLRHNDSFLTQRQHAFVQ